MPNDHQPPSSPSSPSSGSGEWSPPSLGEAARLFPQYQIVRMIGRGGMGAVYLAKQVSLDRMVAIKLLPLEVSACGNFAERFTREARSMAKLSHPNIIAVHDFGQTSEGHLFFVMEFVNGSTLHELIQAAVLAPADMFGFAAQICDALAYAHEKGVVHRDIKPANVLVDTDGHVKIADFGLARLMTVNADLYSTTVTGLVMGTPDYMAPEQKRAMNVDHRADIYSFGVMFYEMLTHEVPQGAFEPVSHRVKVDVRVDGIITKAMRTAPESRWQSAIEIKGEIERIRTHTAVPVPRVVSTPPPKPARTKPRLGIAAGVLALGAIIFAFSGGEKKTPAASGGVIAKATPVTPAKPAPTPQPVVLVTPKPAPKPEPPKPAPPPATVNVEPKPAPPPVVSVEPKPMPAIPANPEPPPAPTAAIEVVKWLADKEAAFAEQWKAEAVAPFDAAAVKLREQYAAGIAKNIADATKAAKLDDALAWRNEKARFDTGAPPHETPDETNDPAALKTLRAWWRGQFAKADSDRFNRAKLVQQRFDALLAQGQSGYTQRQRLDDALLLKTKRGEIRAAWLTPPVDFGKSAVATPKPLGTAMDAPKPNAGLLSGREAMLHLQSLNLNVQCIDSDGRAVNLEKDAVVPPSFKPKDRLEINIITTGGNVRADGQSVTDADFVSLAPMRKLTRIELRANIAASSLGFLAGSPDLTTVSFESRSLTDAAFDPLLGLHKIEQFTAISGAGTLTWARFGEMRSLPNFIQFIANHAEDIPPAVLARAHKLQRLNLRDSRLTEEHFAAIASLPDLVSFSFSGDSEAGAAGLRHLEKCPKLTQLGLPAKSGLRPFLGFIGKMRKLTSLTLDGADAPGLAAAAGAPALRTISLDGQIGISQGASDEGLKVIADSFPRLEELVFIDAVTRNVAAEGIRALATLPKLKSFNWGKRPLPVALATELAALPALESLVIRTCGIDETQLRELAKSKNLIKLDVAHQKLTPAAIEALKGMRGLRDLFVYNCGLTPTDLSALRKALPKCTVRDG